MTDKVQKIREEVERLINQKDENKYLGIVLILELKKVLSFIDSLQEEPVSEELEEACDSYYDETWDEHGGRAMVVDGCHDIWFPSHATDDFFKAGANWQKQQIKKAMDLGEPPYLISVEQAYYRTLKLLEE